MPEPSAAPLTLSQIVQRADRLAAMSLPATPSQRIAVAGTVTLDYLRCAIACAVSVEGVFPVIYQAPFGSLAQEILDPASALHGFAPDWWSSPPRATA